MSSTTNFALPGLMPLDSPVADVTPPYVTLTPFRAEDSKWDGIEAIGPVTINGIAPEETALAAELVLRHELPGICPITLTTENGGVVIADAVSWYFYVPAQALHVIPGPWRWKFRVTTDSGTKTYYEGVLPVLA